MIFMGIYQKFQLNKGVWGYLHGSSKIGVFLGILSLFSLLSCASSTALSLSYTSTTQSPDFVVVISVDAAGSFRQSINLGLNGETLTFYGEINEQLDLRQCAVEEGFLLSSSFSGVDLSSAGGCNTLKTYYKEEIFQGIALELDGGGDLPTAVDLTMAKDATHVFVLFFYNAANDQAANRCFQIFAAEVDDQELLYLNGNQTVRVGSAEVTLLNPDPDTVDSCYSYI